MAFISLLEILYLIILTIIIGYIFSGFIRRPATEHEIYEKIFNWGDFKTSIIVAAPAVILHELGHKFSAILFGLDAVLHIFWEGLGLAIFLKLINSPFLIIAPAYVSISGQATAFQGFITAFSGPLVNLILFLGAWIATERIRLTRNQAIILYLTKQINLLLFIFNVFGRLLYPVSV